MEEKNKENFDIEKSGEKNVKKEYVNVEINLFFIFFTIMFFTLLVTGIKTDIGEIVGMFYLIAFIYFPFRTIVLFTNFRCGCKKENADKNFMFVFLGNLASLAVYIYGVCTSFNDIQMLNCLILVPAEMLIIGFYNIISLGTSAYRSFKNKILLFLIFTVVVCGFFIHLYLLFSGVVFERIRLYI